VVGIFVVHRRLVDFFKVLYLYWRNTMSLRKTSLAVVAALVSVAATGPMSRASFVVTFQQVGSDVVANGSGPIDLSGLTFQGNASNTAVINPSIGLAVVGPTGSTFSDAYSGFSGPSNFGSGSAIEATSGSGDLVGIADPYDLIVPNGYVSGTALSDTSTWSGQTLSSLGITPGTYTWTLGSLPTAEPVETPDGVAGNTFTLIAVAPVPEPASLGLLGICGISLLARRRQI